MTDNSLVTGVVGTVQLNRTRKPGPSPTSGASAGQPRSYAPTIVLAMVLVGATLVRFANLGVPSFPHDESFRANWWYDASLAQMRRFPPLQLLLGWATQHYIGRSELLIRLPYAIAGIATVLALYGLAKRRFGVWAGITTAAIAAGHPVLVNSSRTAKVFALETLWTVLLVWVGLAFCRQSTGGRLLAFLAVALLGLGFTFTSTLVIGGLLPIMLLAWIGTAREWRAPAGGLVVCAVVLAAALGAWYWWLSGCTMRDVFVRYYDVEEPIWPVSYSPRALGWWIAVRGYGVLHFTLGMSDAWPPLNWFIGALAALAVCGATPVAWQRSRPLVLVFGCTAIIAVVAAMARQWPFGDIRHSTFLTPFAVLAVGLGLYELCRRLGRTPAAGLLVAVCVLVPFARAVKATVVKPIAPEHVRPVFDYVQTHMQADDALFIYYASDEPFWFYWRDPSTPALVQPRSDRGDVDLFAERFAAWVSEHGRVWFVSSHDWRTERMDWVNHLRGRYHVLDAITAPNASAHLFVVRDDCDPETVSPDPQERAEDTQKGSLLNPPPVATLAAD